MAARRARRGRAEGSATGGSAAGWRPSPGPRAAARAAGPPAFPGPSSRAEHGAAACCVTRCSQARAACGTALLGTANFQKLRLHNRQPCIAIAWGRTRDCAHPAALEELAGTSQGVGSRAPRAGGGRAGGSCAHATGAQTATSRRTTRRGRPGRPPPGRPAPARQPARARPRPARRAPRAALSR